MAKQKKEEVEPHLLAKRPEWQPDREWPRCGEAGCGVLFSMTKRRHHCRVCGYIFCHEHTQTKVPIPHLGYTTEERVCVSCVERYPDLHDAFERLQQEKNKGKKKTKA
eukprot:TRINITY_DN27473_c0_g1_i1.p4 TRINITY_DN27473_c0_g1~~TRINITY_DN27473_c0_g1_i1.p4  ORF type:complete len:122 (+),score=51.75 TRINITY_DN27473_c0_g1_i1:43-366(+)